MNSNLLSPSSLPTLLQPGALLSLTSAAGLCVEVISGRLWLTEEHDPDDHFVGAGQRHVVQRDGRFVMEADGRVPVRLVFHSPLGTRAGGERLTLWWPALVPGRIRAGGGDVR